MLSRKNSGSASPDKFWNGRTATPGRCSGEAERPRTAVEVAACSRSVTIRNMRTGLSVFSTSCSPRSRSTTDRRADLVAHCAADVDPTRLRQAFQPRCDLHRIAIDPLAMADHVANRNAHTKLNLP